MAEVQPLQTLRYDPSVVGSLDAVIAPPYDVIDAELRARARWRRARSTSSRSTCPTDPDGGDRYAHAARPLEDVAPAGRRWCSEREPALWVLDQDYTAPDGAQRTRGAASSRACAWRTTAPGRIRPHERTHPGPKEDRLRADARHAGQPLPHLQPVPRPRRRRAAGARARHAQASRSRGRRRTRARATRSGGSPTPTRSRRSRRRSPTRELLIADGHHRYETARVYAEEVGGEGEHRYVLMFLCSLAGPGPDGLPDPPPAHRPEGRPRQAGGDPRRRSKRDFEIEHDRRATELEPRGDASGVAAGLHGLASTSSRTG